MNKKVLLQLISTLGLFLLVVTQVFAHTALSKSIPENGASVAESPKSVLLQFNEEVRLLKFSVTVNGEEVAIGFAPTAEASSQFNVAVPQLANGHYSATWTVLGADSHQVSGELTFMVGMMTDEHGGGHGAVQHQAGDSHADHTTSHNGNH